MIQLWHLAAVLVIAASGAPGVETRQASKDGDSTRQIIATTLKVQEEEFCSNLQTPGCREEFREGLRFRAVVLTPAGVRGFFVQLNVTGFCGSGGCALFVLRQEGQAYVSVLRGIGVLEDLTVLRSTTNGSYDLKQTGFYNNEPRNVHYTWTGSAYKRTNSGKDPTSAKGVESPVARVGIA